jgi:hypothetical protein
LLIREAGRRRAAILAMMIPLAGVLAFACGPDQNTITARVNAWMLCNECIASERDSVVSLGSAAVPALRTILINGASQAHLNKLASAIRKTRGPDGAGLPPDTAALTLQLGAESAIYRIRAADALGAIGGTAALAALCHGRAAGFPPGRVTQTIDTAIAHAAAPCP